MNISARFKTSLVAILLFFLQTVMAQKQVDMTGWLDEYKAAIIAEGGNTATINELIGMMNRTSQFEKNKQHLFAAANGQALYQRHNEMGGKVLETKIYALALNRLAFDFNMAGYFNHAYYAALEAEGLWKRLVGETHFNHLESVFLLAEASVNSHDGPKAEQWLDYGLLLTNHPTRTFFRYKLQAQQAYYYMRCDRNQEACQIYEQLLQIEKKDYQWMQGYAQSLAKCGKIEEAIITQNDYIAVKLLQGQRKSSAHAQALFVLATLYQQKGDNENCISQVQKAISLYQELNDKNNATYPACLSLLAECMYRQGNLQKAITYEEQAYDYWKETTNTIEMIASMKDRAVYHSKAGEYEQAMLLANEATGRYNENIRYSMTLSTQDREKIWAACSRWYMQTLPQLTSLIDHSSLYGTLYNAILLSKGLLLNTETSLATLAEEAGGETLKSYTQWQKAKEAYNKPHSLKEDVQLAEQMAVAEKTFMQQCRPLAEKTKMLETDWKAVQKQLTKKDIAIEFLSFKTQKGGIGYYALSLKAKDEAPVWTKLFESDFQNPLSINTMDALIWSRLHQRLQGVTNIYFAPAGELYNLPIESSPSPTGGWMEDYYNLYRLSSTRELVYRNNQAVGKDAVVYGGLRYDTNIDELQIDARQYPELQRNIAIKKRPEADNIRASVSGTAYLPGTKSEAEAIVATINNAKQKDMTATSYIGKRGTEASFKALSEKRKSLIHIATHGFYWSNSEEYAENPSGVIPEDQALTRSGLCMSGVDNLLMGIEIPEGVEDGIMTAQEISLLDLRGLDMAVLSACQTAQGEITGEGVFGLQRGFKKAGAQSIIMSLWSVDDQATQLLMTEFYRHWMNGENKHDALEKAKTTVRMKYNNVNYWAAFVLLDGIE